MGTDALDMMFRCQKEFGVRLTRADLSELLMKRKVTDPPDGVWTDIPVRDVVKWIENSLKNQEIQYEGDIFSGVQKVLMECLAADETEVVLDAWLVRDLGAE